MMNDDLTASLMIAVLLHFNGSMNTSSLARSNHQSSFIDHQ
jgi:hypothetical protein